MCFGIRFGRFYDEIGLAGIRVTVVGRTTVTVASCEFFYGGPAHQVLPEITVFHAVHTLTFYSLVVVKVMAAQCFSLVCGQRGIQIQLERSRQDALVQHSADFVVDRFPPFAFQTMSEHFVEEYGTGFAGKNGRAGIGFCHGSLAQGFGTYGQAPYLVFQFGRSRQVFF